MLVGDVCSSHHGSVDMLECYFIAKREKSQWLSEDGDGFQVCNITELVMQVWTGINSENIWHQPTQRQDTKIVW